ncbi:MAG: glycosyltransferase [Saprospirales bacterium]|nr:MAG: glycosyltransferase [Saprospirales bacterium]
MIIAGKADLCLIHMEKTLPKKIYFAVTNDLSMDQRMHRICSSLGEAGLAVTIVGRVQKGSLPALVGKYQTHRLQCFFNRGPLFYAEMQCRLFFFFLFKKKPDVYGAVDTDTLAAMWLLSKVKSKLLLYDAHEIFDQVPELLKKPWVRKIWRTIERICLPSAKYCWTVNQSLADYFSKVYAKKFTVIRNVPEFFQSQPREKVEKGLILYQGKVNKGRGIEQALDAIKLLPHCRLVVAGGGDLLKAMRQKAKKEGIENVIFTGPQSPDQLKEWTAKAWIGLNLLESESANYYYSLANKFFDYMAHGVPSLSMDFPEYRRINEEFFFSVLIADLQPGVIAQSIKNLLDDELLYQQLSQNATTAFSHLNWQNESRKLLEDLNS